MTQSEFFVATSALLYEWALGEGRSADGSRSILPDDDLFESGLLNSMTAIRLLTILEGWLGAEIDIEAYGMDGFRSLSAIYCMYLGAHPGENRNQEDADAALE